MPRIAAGRTTAAPAVTTPAVALLPALALPKLSAAVPLAVTPHRLAVANASIAHFLIQAGAIREGDVPPVWDDAMEVCQGALDGWVKRELGPLHCLSPLFGLGALDDTDPYTTLRSSRATEPIPYRRVDISWYESGEQQWIVGPRLEAMEQACPGLGQMVLDILQRQSSKVYPVFTPDLAFNVASFLYWCGEDNEESVLDMDCGDDAKAREEMQNQMVTRQKLEEAFPQWATSFSLPRKKQPRAAVKRLVNSLQELALRDIAADTLALAGLHFEDNYQPDVEGEYLGWGAVLSWREDDLTVRIYDDLVHTAHQGEYCDRIGELEINLDAPEAMRSWQKAMRSRFKAIRLIDRLIHRLSERY